MTQHQFLFLPGRWVGAGKITFSNSDELLRFYTSWMLAPEAEGEMYCNQRVELQGVDEQILNSLKVYDVTENDFKIDLESAPAGIVTGKGIIDAKIISWEFHGTGSIEGFEVYELQDNGDYMVHAEYSIAGIFSTCVDGRIWRKETGPVL